jgi:hypothetical protein
VDLFPFAQSATLSCCSSCVVVVLGIDFCLHICPFPLSFTTFAFIPPIPTKPGQVIKPRLLGHDTMQKIVVFVCVLFFALWISIFVVVNLS